MPDGPTELNTDDSYYEIILGVKDSNIVVKVFTINLTTSEIYSGDNWHSINLRNNEEENYFDAYKQQFTK